MKLPERPILECLGGPHDGERIPSRGIFWFVVGRVDKTGKVIPGSAGLYVERDGAYHWQPDDAPASEGSPDGV